MENFSDPLRAEKILDPEPPCKMDFIADPWSLSLISFIVFII